MAGMNRFGRIRVHELAKELGLTNQECLGLCADMGIDVKRHSSNVWEAQADRVRRRAEREGLVRPQQPTPDLDCARNLAVECEQRDRLAVGDASYTPREIVVDDLGGSFADAIDATLVTVEDGAIVTGTVVRVDRDEVLLDIGYKSKGVIPSRELSIRNDVDPSDVVSVGDSLEALVLTKEDKDGRLVLSKKRAQYERAWGDIERIKEEEGVVSGPVIEVARDGLIMDVGLRGFLPASQIELTPVRDLWSYLGRVLEAKVIGLDPNRSNVVLSRQALLAETQREQREDSLATAHHPPWPPGPPSRAARAAPGVTADQSQALVDALLFARQRQHILDKWDAVLKHVAPRRGKEALAAIAERTGLGRENLQLVRRVRNQLAHNEAGQVSEADLHRALGIASETLGRLEPQDAQSPGVDGV
jgi:predicted RNA-binding protein with RPS1 domain